MDSAFKLLETSRKLYLEIIGKYTLEQLNKIPQGFNNNIIWNIGHIIVAQQSLTYKSSGLQGHIPEELFSLYKPGTKPTTPVTQDHVNELKRLLPSLVEQTKADFKNGIFQTFTERSTSTGFHLGSLTDAIEVNNYHEGLHFGYIMSIRKFV